MKSARITSRALSRALDSKPKKKPKPKVFTSLREVEEYYGIKPPETRGVLVILPRGYR